MSLLIQSFDVDSGNSYDGTWNFNGNIRGEYNLKYCWIDSATVPWIWNGSNVLHMVWDMKGTVIPNFNSLTPAEQFTTIGSQGEDQHYTITLAITNGLLTGGSVKSDVATDIVNKMKAATNVDHTIDVNPFAGVSPYVTLSMTYDGTTDSYTMTLHNQIGPSNYFYFGIGWSDPASSAAGLFDESGYTILELGNGETGTISGIKAQHIGQTNPKFLQMEISEATGGLVTSCVQTNGCLLISLTDLPYLDQIVNVSSNTSSLNILLKRNNISASAVPITANWILVLQR